jgi:hypothetical protein
MDKQSISMLNIFAMTTLTAFIGILFMAAAITANAQIPGITPQQASIDEQLSLQEQQSTASGQADTITIQKTS